MTHRFRAILAVLVVGGAAACDDNNLPDATQQNVLDTTSLGAIVGTDLRTPSAFSVADLRAVRTDASSSFDFVFNIDASGQAVFIPREVLGLPAADGVNPGLQKSTRSFDDIRIAVQNGYVSTDTVKVAVGDVYFARSRVTCSLGVPLYGKLEILALDPVARTIQFRHLINPNCGYRGLGTGIPEE